MAAWLPWEEASYHHDSHATKAFKLPPANRTDRDKIKHEKPARASGRLSSPSCLLETDGRHPNQTRNRTQVSRRLRNFDGQEGAAAPSLDRLASNYI